MSSIFSHSFPASFDSYAVEGEFLETVINGVTYNAVIELDNTAHIDDDDVHNPDQNITGCTDEQQQQLLLARTAWFRNEWFYCGIVIIARACGITLASPAATLWGLVCNYPGTKNEHLTEVANELLPEAIEEATQVLHELRELKI